MTYKRTASIRKKQSLIQKENWRNNREYMLSCLEKRDMSNAGRSKTFIRYEKKCEVCDNMFVVKCTAHVLKKYCSRKCYMETKKGKPVVSSDFLRNMDRSYMQTEKYSASKRKHDTPAYRKYSNRVATLTRRTYEAHKDIINPNNYSRTLAGVDGGYQLDHKLSVRFCFDNGIPAEDVAKLENLQMLPWKTNLLKG